MSNLENRRCSGPPNQVDPVNAPASANAKNSLETDKSTEKCESFQKVIAPLGLCSGNERRILDELSASSAAAKPESLLKAVQDPTSSKKAVTDPETQGCVIKFDQYRDRSSRAVPDAKPQGDGHINNNTGLPSVPSQNTYKGEEVFKIMKVKVKKIPFGQEPYEAVVAGKIDSIHIGEFMELDENPFAPVGLEKFYQFNPTGNNNDQRKQCLGKLGLWRKALLEIEVLMMANGKDDAIASVKRLSTNLVIKDVTRSTYRVEYHLECHQVQGRGPLLMQAKALIEKKIKKLSVKLITYRIPPKDNDRNSSSSGSSFEDDSFPEGEAPDWAKSKSIGTSKTNTPKDDEHSHIPMDLKPDKENTTKNQYRASSNTEVIEKETELDNSVCSDKFQGDPTSSKKSKTNPKICRCEPRIKK